MKQIDLPGLPDFEALLQIAIKEISKTLGGSNVPKSQVIHSAIQRLDQEKELLSLRDWQQLHEQHENFRSFDKRIIFMASDADYERISDIREYMLCHPALTALMIDRKGKPRITTRMIAVFAVVYLGMKK